MIEYACPFAPGETKPESMKSPRRTERLSFLKNKRLIVLVFSVLCLILIYTNSYPYFEWEGSKVLFRDGYIVKMSFYTYLSSMITYFIREFRKNNE